MCNNCKENIIKDVKVVLLAGSLSFRNGITLNGSNVELGGTLLGDTDLIGLFKLNLGTNTSRLSQLNVKVSNKILLDYNNGTNNILLNIDTNGAIITDTINNRGLVGAANFSAAYTNFTYIQKIYADTKLVSKDIDTLLSNPLVSQNGYAIKWDNSAGKFTLGAVITSVPGSDKQVIFNDGGVLGTNVNFTYNKTTGELQGGYLFTLKDFNATGAVNIAAAGTGDISIGLNPLGNGDIKLNIVNTGTILLGSSLNTATVKLRANGSSSSIDLILSPKGTTGIVYIGDNISAGGTRTLQAIGTLSNIDLIIAPKGTGVLNASGARWTNLAPGVNPTDAATVNQIPVVPSSPPVSPVVIDIGDWNMMTTPVLIVSLPITYSKIRSVSLLIKDDSDTNKYNDGCMALGATQLWIQNINVTGPVIGLERLTAGVFDVPSFTLTGYNRGWLIIELIP